MDYKQKYREETNKEPYNQTKTGVYVKSGSYSDDYVKWLEKQLELHNVVGQTEQLVCSCGSRLVKTTGGYHCGNTKCSV